MFDAVEAIRFVLQLKTLFLSKKDTSSMRILLEDKLVDVEKQKECTNKNKSGLHDSIENSTNNFFATMISSSHFKALLSLLSSVRKIGAVCATSKNAPKLYKLREVLDALHVFSCIYLLM